MEPLISVIVPVYKVEKYLDRCVESIVNQTYNNLEIILVDDGSPDNCLAMCDAWAEKDSRIKVIHKENGGVSSARNAGLEIAKGKFIHFIDSDDWLDLNCYSELNEVLSDDCQLVVFSAYLCNDEEKSELRNAKSQVLAGNRDIRIKFLNGELNWYNCWSKLFSLEIIQKNNITFNENYSIGEDYIFNYEYLNYINKVNIVDKIYYYYYTSRNDSAMNSKNAKYFSGWKAYEEKYIQESDCEIKELSLKLLLDSLLTLSIEGATLNLDNRSYRELTRNFQKYYKKYKSANKVRSKSMMLLNASPIIFKWLYKYVLED